MRDTEFLQICTLKSCSVSSASHILTAVWRGVEVENSMAENDGFFWGMAKITWGDFTSEPMVSLIGLGLERPGFRV